MMTRTEKKVLLVSSAAHGLLILTLLFGSALMPEPVTPPSHIFKMNLIPETITDGPSGGGNPDANVVTPTVPVSKPPAEAPAAPIAPVTPPAPPKAIVEPVPPKPVADTPKPPTRVEPPKTVHQKIETPRLPKPPKIEEPPKHWYDSIVGTKTKPEKVVEEPAPPKKHEVKIGKDELAMHKNTERATTKDDANNREAQRQASREFGKTLAGLKKDLHAGSPLQIPDPGIGGGGQAVADFGDVLVSKYFNAWSPPTDLDSGVPDVVVAVTIARDGSVMSARIISPSGIRSLDRSIQNALDAVAFIAPFPPSWKEAQRIEKVRFNLRQKRQTG